LIWSVEKETERPRAIGFWVAAEKSLGTRATLPGSSSEATREVSFGLAIPLVR